MADQRENKSLAQKVLSNILWQVGAKLVTACFTIFVFGKLIRSSGYEVLGAFSNVQALVGVVGVFCLIINQHYLSNKILSDYENRKIYISSTMFVSLTVGVFSYILTILLAYAFSGGYEEFQLYLVGGLTHFFYFTVATAAFFQAELLARVNSILSSAGFIATRVIQIFLLQSEEISIVQFFAAEVVGMALISATGLICYRIKYGRLNIFSNIKIWAIKEMLKECAPLIGAAFIMVALSKVDILMLRIFTTLEEVGTYSASATVMNSALLVSGFLVTSVLPLLHRAKQINTDLYVKCRSEVFRVFAMCAWLIVIGVFFMAGWIAELWTGSSNWKLELVMRIHALCLVPFFLSKCSENFFLMENLGKRLFANSLCSLCVNTVLNFCVASTYGAVGVSIATLVSYCVGFILTNIMFKSSRHIGITQLSSFFRPYTLLKNVRSVKAND